MYRRIEIIQGDITKVKADAIVNAANNSLLGGGGVDGAIHRAAGPQLLQECRMLTGCDTGEAKTTEAYLLPSKKIIHTVGPIWKGGGDNEEALLHSCYSNCFEQAQVYNLNSISFPNISTGIYGFPKLKAAKIARAKTLAFLKMNKGFNKVIFVIFEPDNYEIYKELFKLQT